MTEFQGTPTWHPPPTPRLLNRFNLAVVLQLLNKRNPYIARSPPHHGDIPHPSLSETTDCNVDSMQH